MLGAFVHSSYALKCYKCDSVLGGDCDDPYDNGSEHECGDAKYKSCFKAKGKATFGTEEKEGVVRGCAEASEDSCTHGIKEAISFEGFDGKLASGDLCYCKDELCNSAPQTPAGRLAVSFTVTSLLALATARFLSL